MNQKKTTAPASKTNLARISSLGAMEAHTRADDDYHSRKSVKE
jgi:hypothetical protein